MLMLTKQRRIILTLHLSISLKLLSGSLSLYKQAFIALIKNSSKKKILRIQQPPPKLEHMVFQYLAY